MENGADVNAQGGEYDNALQAACCRGHIEVVKWLVENGVEVNAQGGHYGNALQAACGSFIRYRREEKRLAIVMFLLDKGADVNARGGEYGTALTAARHNDYPKIVEILLEAGAIDDDSVQDEDAIGYDSEEQENAVGYESEEEENAAESSVGA